MHWLEIATLFFVTLVGGALVLFTKPLSKSAFTLLLTFGGAFLIGLSFLHLMPSLFSGSLSHPEWFLLGGFLIQVLLELGTKGMEHGHVHDHGHQSSPITFSLAIALAVHAIIEGMPFGNHDHHHHALLVGILLHKVPVAMVLASFLLAGGMSKLRAFFVLVAFACMAPLGTLLYYLIGSNTNIPLESLTVACTAILVGMLLHISTTILFEANEGHKMSISKLIVILLGLGLAAFS